MLKKSRKYWLFCYLQGYWSKSLSSVGPILAPYSRHSVLHLPLSTALLQCTNHPQDIYTTFQHQSQEHKSSSESWSPAWVPLLCPQVNFSSNFYFRSLTALSWAQVFWGQGHRAPSHQKAGISSFSPRRPWASYVNWPPPPQKPALQSRTYLHSLEVAALY